MQTVTVRHQRVSHWLMALSLVEIMTEPLLDVLHTIARALFGGVFFAVGSPSIYGNQIPDNVLFCFRKGQFVEPDNPRLALKCTNISHYSLYQIVGAALSVALLQTIGAIGFPVTIIALTTLRLIILRRAFHKDFLLTIDGPTARAEVVLASVGGQPWRPEPQRETKRLRQRFLNGELPETTKNERRFP